MPVLLLIQAFNQAINCINYNESHQNSSPEDKYDCVYNMVKLFMDSKVPVYLEKKRQYTPDDDYFNYTITVFSPFWTACSLLDVKNRKTLSLFLKKGLKLPFWAACRWGDTERMKELIAKGVNINRNEEVIIPIMVAVGANQPEAVELLVKNNCKLDLQKEPMQYDNNPLYIAAENGYYKVAEILVTSGRAQINHEGANYYIADYPLYAALFEKHYDIAELLLKNGARTDMIENVHEGPYKWRETIFDKFKKDPKATALLKKYGKAKYLKHLRPPIPPISEMLKMLKN